MIVLRALANFVELSGVIIGALDKLDEITPQEYKEKSENIRKRVENLIFDTIKRSLAVFSGLREHRSKM